MKSFNWFNDLSSILTQDLATAAVEETEPESMEFLANELGDKVEKLSQISWKEMFERYVPVVCDYLLRIALVLVIFFVGRKLIKKIVSLCDQALKRHGMEVTVRRFFCNVINALGYICMLGILLQTVGLTATSLTALVASAGVAVGLALQGSLSNFAGGVLILLMKPFVIGDYIVQGNTEGTVKEIGLVYTELITADNRLIVIPNGTLIDSSIVNVTATGKRRLELSVGIGYKSDLKKAKEVLIRLGENDPARDPENPVNVHKFCPWTYTLADEKKLVFFMMLCGREYDNVRFFRRMNDTFSSRRSSNWRTSPYFGISVTSPGFFHLS